MPPASPTSAGFAPSQIPAQMRRGRGATQNLPGRFERTASLPDPEIWEASAEGEEPLPPLRTTVHAYRAREALTRVDSPDLPFDRSLNPYRGCEHGCVYCYARPTHAYLGLSAGLDFETQIFAKTDAAERLEEALRRPGYRPAPIAIGTVTDPYQPVERERMLMRPILKTLLEARHPAVIVTKSASILRDADLLMEMARHGLAAVAISVTTLDRRLARAMEPRASSPQRRIGAIAALSAAGVPVTVMVAPVIMGFNEHELEMILKAASGAGAVCARYQPLRLPGETRAVFDAWLEENFPERAARVRRAVAEMEDHGFGTRFKGRGLEAQLLAQRFAMAVRRHGLSEPPKLRSDLFRRPARRGDQINFFDVL